MIGRFFHEHGGILIEGEKERERGVGGQRALKSDLQGFIGVLATNGCQATGREATGQYLASAAAFTSA